MNWLRKWWRWLVAGVAAIIGVIIVVHGKRAIEEWVMIRRQFRLLPGRDDVIEISDGAEWVEVQLPPGVTALQVDVAGVSEDGAWAVEVEHIPTDRRGDSDRGRGSGLGL